MAVPNVREAVVVRLRRLCAPGVRALPELLAACPLSGGEVVLLDVKQGPARRGLSPAQNGRHGRELGCLCPLVGVGAFVVMLAVMACGVCALLVLVAMFFHHFFRLSLCVCFCCCWFWEIKVVERAKFLYIYIIICEYILFDLLIIPGISWYSLNLGIHSFTLNFFFFFFSFFLILPFFFNL